MVTPVKNPSPSLLNVTPVPTINPDLAVTNPTESILVTSSYVKVPPIVTLPLNVPFAE